MLMKLTSGYSEFAANWQMNLNAPFGHKFKKKPRLVIDL